MLRVAPMVRKDGAVPGMEPELAIFRVGLNPCTILGQRSWATPDSGRAIHGSVFRSEFWMCLVGSFVGQGLELGSPKCKASKHLNPFAMMSPAF